jgi:adenylyltransferase/sulfurtransferase
LILPEVGEAGQDRLRQSRVLIVGAGGLGSPAALYLAAAGVGTIGLVDFDYVDRSNLQRQVLYTETDLGAPKVEAADARLSALNPDITIEVYPERFSIGNAAKLVSQYDCIVDGSDNFSTRYLVADACALLKKPNVHGAIFRFDGQLTVFWPPQGPCYRCLFPDPPPPDAVPNCAEAGVLGVLPGVLGCLQASETIKLLLGVGEPLIGRMLMFDALAGRFREVRLSRAPHCPLCGENPTIRELKETLVEECTAHPVPPGEPHADCSVEELHRRIKSGESLLLIDVRKPEERDICRIDGAIAMVMDDVPKRMGELDPNREMIIHCRSGKRSATVAGFLRSQGFSNVRNLAGGILEWIDKIEPHKTKY